MHPLSLFPQLFSYPFLAYFILRLVVACTILRVAMLRWKKPWKSVALFDVLAGVLVLIGLYTQGALIATIILFIKDAIIDWKLHIPTSDTDRTVMVIVGIIAFCLLFLGPGSFSLDMPL